MIEQRAGVGVTTEETSVSAVSWAAVAAGAVAAAALTLALVAFGVGMGFSAVSPWSNSGPSATAFEVATGIYLCVVAMLASTVGGYLAGRLRTKWTGLHTNEVVFRDTAHGFLAWAFATVISAAVLGSATTTIVGGAASGATPAAAAASQASGAQAAISSMPCSAPTHRRLSRPAIPPRSGPRLRASSPKPFATGRSTQPTAPISPSW